MSLTVEMIETLLPRFAGGQISILNHVERTMYRGQCVEKSTSFTCEHGLYMFDTETIWMCKGIGSYLAPTGWCCEVEGRFFPHYIIKTYELSDIQLVNKIEPCACLRIEVRSTSEIAMLIPRDHPGNLDPRSFPALYSALKLAGRLH